METSNILLLHDSLRRITGAKDLCIKATLRMAILRGLFTHGVYLLIIFKATDFLTFLSQVN